MIYFDTAAATISMVPATDRRGKSYYNIFRPCNVRAATDARRSCFHRRAVKKLTERHSTIA